MTQEEKLATFTYGNKSFTVKGYTEEMQEENRQDAIKVVNELRSKMTQKIKINIVEILEYLISTHKAEEIKKGQFINKFSYRNANEMRLIFSIFGIEYYLWDQERKRIFYTSSKPFDFELKVQADNSKWELIVKNKPQ